MSQILKNNVSGVLSASINNTTTSISLINATNFPTPQAGEFYYVTLFSLNSNGQESAWEIVRVTAKANNTLTVVRGQEGTVALSWPGSTTVQLRLTADSVVTPTGTQTLTNKTISTDSNSIGGIAASSFVVSNASGNIDGSAAQKVIPAGAVVGTTDTQTLTNKTINLSNNTLVATSAQFASALSDETGTGSVVFSNSPAFTGTPTAPTAAVGTNTTQIATTAHVFAERSNTATLTNKTLTSPTVNNGSLSLGSGSLVFPQTTSPSQTAEGSVVWDSDNDLLTVGTGSGRKTLVDTDSVQTLINKSISGGQITGDISGNAFNVTGTVAIANGGTGATSAAAAKTNFGLNNVTNESKATMFTNPVFTGTVTAGGAKIRSWTAADTDIDALIPGSAAGVLIEGPNSGQVVIGVPGNDSSDGFYIIDNNNVIEPASYAQQVLAVTNATFAYKSQNIFHDGYHPNADALTNPVNIALTGAVTGNANFDGSGNISIATTHTADPVITLTGDVTGSGTMTNLGSVSITATVADDSHNHVISNVDGLQTALDAKAPLISPGLTGTPTAPTAAAGTNTTQIATTAHVFAERSNSATLTNKTISSPNITGRASVDAAHMTKTSFTSASGTVTLNLASANVFYIQPSAAITIALSNVDTAKATSLIIHIVGGGSHTVTFPTAFKWNTGVAPTLTASPGVDIIAAQMVDGVNFRAAKVQTHSS